MELPDEKKLEFLKGLPPEIVWKMAEGNPQDDITSGGEKLPTPILNVLSNLGDKENSEPEKAD